VIVTFTWPSTHHYAGGVRVLWELANGLARRGHEVHFVHGPAWPDRITSLDQLPSFPWEPSVRHHIVDSLDDPELPQGDVVFNAHAPSRLGLPLVFIQGFQMLPKYERAAFRARAPKVCVARWLVDIGLQMGAPPEQLWHVPLGLDHGLFAVRRPIDDRPFDVAIVHNEHPSKGWAVGLDALERVRSRRPGAKILVAGANPPAEPLPPEITVRSGLDQHALAHEVYNATKVFVQPSFHEGFGYPAVEAMACGAALVTTDNGGSRDYALPGETAVVVPVGDAAALAHGIDGLLDDPEERVRLATNGERYVRRFDWDRSADLLAEHLERYVADPDAYQRPPREEAST
jgi:glycosyltransferase involved in cell wall biosynthesis